MSDDFYCDEVLSGNTPVEVVEASELVLAFRHTRPNWATHVVVVPRKHVPSLLELAGEEGLTQELMATVQRVAAAVVAERGGAHIVTNLGKYQESKHLHFHVGSD